MCRGGQPCQAAAREVVECGLGGATGADGDATRRGVGVYVINHSDSLIDAHARREFMDDTDAGEVVAAALEGRGPRVVDDIAVLVAGGVLRVDAAHDIDRRCCRY